MRQIQSYILKTERERNSSRVSKVTQASRFQSKDSKPGLWCETIYSPIVSESVNPLMIKYAFQLYKNSKVKVANIKTSGF